MSTLTATLEAFNRVEDTKDYDKTVHNPEGEVEIVSKMNGMDACVLCDAVAKTSEGLRELIGMNIELDKNTIYGVFTLMSHASQNVSDYMDMWMADQYRQQQRQKTA